MTNPTAPLSLPRTLARVGFVKLQLRWMVVLRGITAAVFWTAVAITGSWLRHFGYNWLFLAFVGAWFVVALPMLYFQLSMVVDLLGYLFTGKITFFPLLRGSMEATTESERAEFRRAMLPAPLDTVPTTNTAPVRATFLSRVLVPFLAFTSPLACFSTWCLVVLVRLPDSVHHLTVMNAKKVGTMQIEAERQVYTEAVARLLLK